MSEALRVNSDRPAQSTRRAEVRLKLANFEIPPIHDCLILGKRAPIGTEAARLMIESVSPNQFQVVRVDHPEIESVVIRKALLKAIPADQLVALLLEEAQHVLSDHMALKVSIDLTVHSAREVPLG